MLLAMKTRNVIGAFRLLSQLNSRLLLVKLSVLRSFVKESSVARTTAIRTQTNVNSGPVTTATIPYTRGTSETIARTLQLYNIRVAHKPITTLRQLLTNVKDTNRRTDREQYTRSNAATARLLTLMKPAETLARD